MTHRRPTLGYAEKRPGSAPTKEPSDARELRDVIEWMRPSIARRPKDRGASAHKMMRHVLFDEPLDPNDERPWDEGDLMRCYLTAETAPDHLREAVASVLATYEEWLEADKGFGVVEIARELAKARASRSAA